MDSADSPQAAVKQSSATRRLTPGRPSGRPWQPRSWLGRAAAWGPVLALAGAAAARILHLQFWPVELLWHFTETFFFLSLILTVVLLAFSFYAPAAAAAALAVFFGLAASNVPGGAVPHAHSVLPAAQAYAGEAQGPAEAGFRLVTHNLYVRNKRRDDLAAWLRRQDADVIVIQEVDMEMAAVMQAAVDRYPHQFFGWPRNWVERPDQRHLLNGLAILSRFPLKDGFVFRQTKWNAPVASARLTLSEGTEVRLVVVHTMNPIRRSGLRARNALMSALAEELKDYKGPLVVAGDFNATPYTPAFARFLKAADLTTNRGYPGTYPQFAGAFGLPIDHVLARGVLIADIEALDAFGSDHRPLRADLIVPVAKRAGG